MKKLYYNIYSNITERQFFSIEKRLKTLQYKVSRILLSVGWKLTTPVGSNDGLTFNLSRKEGIFRGSIGISFEDKPGKISFTFGVIKYFDEDNYRYGLKHILIEDKEFIAFEKEITELTRLALQKYDSWTKEDILLLGEKDKIDWD